MNYKTDVLIIGAGGAGYHAAIEARKLGVNVLLVNKSGGNATIMAAGGFAVSFNEYNKNKLKQTNEIFINDISKSGRNINNIELAKQLIEKSYQDILKLKNQNINFMEDEDNNLKVFQAAGHSCPRTVRCLDGNTLQYYSEIRSKALKLGVEIKNSTTIIDLVKKDDKIQGAIGICDNKSIFISCQSIVLVTGGFASNYNVSTHNKTIQGLGLTMALKAGAELIDMEFIQFMPTVITYPEKLKGIIVTDTLRGEGATLLNKKFERFMKKYSPLNKEMETRDKVSQSIFQEIYEKRGTKNNAVYLDARHIDRETIKNSFTNYELLMKEGIDPKKVLIEVSPSAHYTCGGIKIDKDSFTGVEGLWAAGEVVGGLHGANRLGSIALIENVVFGRIAGKNAALHSLRSPNNLKNKEFKYKKNIKHGSSERMNEIEKNLRVILSNIAGIVRNESDLIKGLKELEDIMNELNKSNDESIYNLRLIELKSFALINYCVMRSSIMRKESRGTHFRIDYPKEKKNLAKTINITQKDDVISHCCENIK